MQPYPLNDLLNTLLATFHLQECFDLRERQILSVSQCHQLIICAEQLERIAEDLSFVETLADACGHLRKEMQTVDVLQNVRLTIGNENHVELIQWLVHKSHIVLFDRSMLGLRVRKLGERGQESFNARARNIPKLARKNSFTSAGTDGCSEDDLQDAGQIISSTPFPPITDRRA